MKYPITKSDILRYYHINKSYTPIRYLFDDGTYSKKISGMFILLDANKNIVPPDDYEQAHSVWFLSTSPLRGMEKNNKMSTSPIDIFAISKGIWYKTHLFNYSFQDTIKNPKTNFYFFRK